MKKIITILLSLVMLVTAFAFTACGDNSGELSNEQVAKMNEAIQATDNWDGSYTIKETMSYNVSAAGQVEQGNGTASVSYNAQDGSFIYLADVLGVNVMVYTAKNADNSYTQYVDTGYKFKTDYPNLDNLNENGFTAPDGLDGTYGFYLDGLSEALNTYWKIDLSKAADVETAEDYGEFWQECFNDKLTQLSEVYGFEITCTLGECAESTDGGKTIYTFNIVGSAEAGATLMGLSISEFNLTLAVTTTIEEGKLVQLKCDVSQSFKLSMSGMTATVSAVSSSIDDFYYTYDATLAPTADELAAFN